MNECKDCKHYDGALCLRTAKRVGHVVEGARKPHLERSYGVVKAKMNGTCGTKGRFFEPKE